MAGKTREAYNAYMKEYILRRYHRRRSEAIEKLGGCCSKCGSEESLEIDHIDPATKTIDIGKVWSYSNERFWAEIYKCQILCQSCHAIKTITDRGHKPAKGTHGTLSAYRYCKCDKCREAKNKWQREWKKAKRIKDKLAQP